MEKPFGVILAGGAGRRIGGDKAFVALAGRPLARHVADRVGPHCARLAVNSNESAARFGGLGFDTVLPDAGALARGPLEGILTAMLWASAQGADRVLTVPVDTPFLPDDLVPRLVAESDAAPEAAVALAETADGMHGTVGFWRIRFAANLATALDGGLRKVTDWTGAQGAVTARFDDAGAFFNINRPEDLIAAETRLAGP